METEEQHIRQIVCKNGIKRMRKFTAISAHRCPPPVKTQVHVAGLVIVSLEVSEEKCRTGSQGAKVMEIKKLYFEEKDWLQ